MEAPYLEGVPYLSREEEALARRLWLSRQDKAAVMDIKLRDDDPESLEFVRRVRNEIDGWKNWNDEEVVRITAPFGCFHMTTNQNCIA